MRPSAPVRVSLVLCLVSAPAWAGPHPPGPTEVMRRSDAAIPAQPRQAPPVRAALFGEEDRSLAPFFQVAGGPSEVERLPLEATRADVAVTGVIAHVRLRQVFRNGGERPIEVVYVFPASTRAAIHDLRMKIGARTVEAKLLERQQARETFEAAKGAGQRAALLEQQRANVFTTRVANVMPGDRIEVELEYSELLVPEDGVYEVVIPGVVGPRYPGGADPQADRWIASPYLHEGKPEPWTFDAKVRLETALPLKDVSSPSHKVAVDYRSNAVAEIRLDEPGGGNRDFIVRYRLAGEQILAGALTWRGEKEGFFAVMVEPPAAPRPEQVVPREYVFVVDVSGSMNGFPIEVSKALMRDLLGRLRPADHFNVLVFAGRGATLSPSSLPASPTNIHRGLAFVNAQGAGGGTELMAALEAAYALPRVSRDVARTLVVATDGYVAVEGQAYKLVRERLGEANLFAFGIGGSVNRAILEGLARAGGGEPWVVTSAGAAPQMAEKFRRAIEQPVLTDIQVRYLDGFEAREVAPMRLPDLMARRPLVLFGKFSGAAKGAIEVSGNAGGKRWQQVIRVDGQQQGEHRRALRWLWARKWVELLEDQHHLTGADELKQAITDLGLAYRLVTPFTSFVAVDSEVANRTGEVTAVTQPLPLPEGVSNMAVGGALRGMPGRVGGAGQVGVDPGSRSAVPGGAEAGDDFDAVFGGSGSGRKRPDPPRSGPNRQSRDYYTPPPPLSRDPEPRRTVTAERPRVSGRLSTEVVAGVAAQNREQVQACYEQGVRRGLALGGGRLVLHFIVKPDGTVEKVVVLNSTLKSEAVERCVADRLRRWTFPEPKDGARAIVILPWTFEVEPSP